MLSPSVKTRRRTSLAWLAILALAVILFSYLLTLAIAVACAVLPILGFVNGFGGIGGLVVIALGVIMSGTIFWSLLPRRDEFKRRVFSSILGSSRASKRSSRGLPLAWMSECLDLFT